MFRLKAAVGSVRPSTAAFGPLATSPEPGSLC
jgi:hypothetical protein